MIEARLFSTVEDALARRPGQYLVGLDGTSASTIRECANALTMAVRRSRKFVLEEDAAELVQAARSDVRRVAFQFAGNARPPFPDTWVEMPYDRHHGHGVVTMERLGFLFQELDEDQGTYRVTTITNDHVHPIGLLVRPHGFGRDEGWTDSDNAIGAGGRSRRDLEKQFARDALFDHEVASRMMEHVRIDLGGPAHLPLRRNFAIAAQRPSERLASEGLSQFVVGSVFQAYAALSVLGVLTAGERIVGWGEPAIDVRRPASLPRGRRFVEHHTVRLLLPAEAAMNEIDLAFGSGIPRRAHEVKGHYAVRVAGRDGARRTCFHEWSEPDEEDRRVCARCNALRYWRPTHMRGDASLGIVTKDYSVSARR